MAEKTNVVTWESQGADDIIYACEHTDLRTLTSVTVPESTPWRYSPGTDSSPACWSPGGT